MVTFAVELCQFSIELGKHMNKHIFKGRQGFAVKYLFPVCRDKHQMNVHSENAMPAASDIRIFLHKFLVPIKADNV